MFNINTNKRNLQGVLSFLMKNKPESAILEIMKEDPNRALGDFIEKYPNSNALFFLDYNPDSGLLEIIENNIDDPVIQKIEDNPERAGKIILEARNQNPEYRKLMTALSDNMEQTLIRKEKVVVKLLNKDLPTISEDEYFLHFHPLFTGKKYDGSEMLPEERASAIDSWLKVARSYSQHINIVDKDGKILMEHPGLGGSMDTNDGGDFWHKFEVYSKINSGNGEKPLQAFQFNEITKMSTHLKNTLPYTDENKRNHQLMRKVVDYFDIEVPTEVSSEPTVAKETPVVEKVVKPKTKETKIESEGWGW